MAKRTENSKLYEALRFVSLAQRDLGSDMQTHCVMHDGDLLAFDGIVAVSTPIDEQMFACPHTWKFLSAIERCGAELAITQLPTNRLSVRSGKFKATIPCVTAARLAGAIPDAARIAVDDRLIAALDTVGVLISDTAQTVLCSSALLQSNTSVATDREMCIEAWHGFDLGTENNAPIKMLIPKTAINVLGKCKKALTGLGWSKSSVTFHFDDTSWVRTQLYDGGFPAYEAILSTDSQMQIQVTETFFEDIAKLEPFSEDGCLRFNGNIVQTHDSAEDGATHAIDIPIYGRYMARQIAVIAEIATHLIPQKNKLLFVSTMARGAVGNKVR
jgi:hypothetical protein